MRRVLYWLVRNLVGRPIQFILNCFYFTRLFLVNLLVYLSIRLYGTDDYSFREVWNGSSNSRMHVPRNLDDAKDLDTLLETARSCYKNALERRGFVNDKCKTLLTVTSILLAIAGLFLPKLADFDSGWVHWSVLVAGLLLFSVMILLLKYFGVGLEMQLILGQEEVGLSTDDLKKTFINSNLQCQVSTDNRTDYLTEIYKACQFFASLAFVIILVVLIDGYWTRAGSNKTAEKVIQQMRSDPKLIELLRGPKGEKGDVGGRAGSEESEDWKKSGAAKKKSKMMNEEKKDEGIKTSN